VKKETFLALCKRFDAVDSCGAVIEQEFAQRTEDAKKRKCV